MSSLVFSIVATLRSVRQTFCHKSFVKQYHMCLLFRRITCKDEEITFIMMRIHLQFWGRNSKISSSDSKLSGHFKYLPRSEIKMFKIIFCPCHLLLVVQYISVQVTKWSSYSNRNRRLVESLSVLIGRECTMRLSPLQSVNWTIYENVYLAIHSFPAPLFQMTNS